MMKRMYVVVGNGEKVKGGHDEGKVVQDGGAEVKVNRFWEDEGYGEYVRRFGLHFTDELARWASERMVNATGKARTWSAGDVKTVMKSLGKGLPKGATMGDAVYLANMFYADLGKVMGDELDAVRFAVAQLEDPDGYEGQTFVRWTADVMQGDVEVEWEEFL